jgi:mRNA interferase MazF
VRRGEIYLVRFDPGEGAEIRKTRPAVILQNDVANARSPITIVAAITSRVDDILYPTEIRVDPPEGGLTASSVIVLNQIRSMDKRRLLKRLGALAPETMVLVDRALIISLGLPRRNLGRT